MMPPRPDPAPLSETEAQTPASVSPWWCETCGSWRASQPCGRDECPTPDDPTPPSWEDTLTEKLSRAEAENARLLATVRALQQQNEALIAFIEALNDRLLENLREGQRQGSYHGDVYDAPNDCETLITVTRGELRRALQEPLDAD